MNSGLYQELVDLGYLIPHTEVPGLSSTSTSKSEKFKVIKPENVPFISYFYEWPFSMLKDAALLTLSIQKKALERGMILKDASAYNIQFVRGKPILIDTLSFEKYEEGSPWVAYKQFVEHFLAPLALMSYVDVRLNRLGFSFVDGIPVDLAADILPFKARFNPRLLFHIFAHAKSSKKYSDKKLGKNIRDKRFSKRALLGLIDNLEGTVKSFSWRPQGTQWEDYYEDDKNNYKSESRNHKAQLVEQYLKTIKAKNVWDYGANTGFFSRIAKKTGAKVVSFDVDFGALEKHYLFNRHNNEEDILPLFSDLTNPTPPLGWESRERLSFFERGPADAVLALAIVHHLAIPFNVPFAYLAEAFSKMGKHLIVEFIEKTDSQVQILLSSREDIFDKYTKEDFENAFSAFFKILKSTQIRGSKRTLYLMEKR